MSARWLMIKWLILECCINRSRCVSQASSPPPRAGMCLAPAVIVACRLSEACVDIYFVIYLA